jgi:hypothetical protein
MNDLLSAVFQDVERYCHNKGYHEGPGINNFVPHDPVLAFAMAKRLIGEGGFEHYVVVAPEGHIYGYFFEKLGARTMATGFPFPATRIELRDDFSIVRFKRLLIIKDVVVSGGTLWNLAEGLSIFRPKSIDLFLGHSRCFQHLEKVPYQFRRTYLADEVICKSRYDAYDALVEEFTEYFTGFSQRRIFDAR